MPQIAIKHHRTKTVLHAGHFSGLRAAVEDAVRTHVRLDGADLRHANLALAGLDGAALSGARLDGANLTGANLSESVLSGTSLAGTTLHGACLCFSDLENCDFCGALFGGTDIAGTRLDRSRFAGLSTFSLNFIDADSLKDCLYLDTDGQKHLFSHPPLVVLGLPQPLILTERHIQVGHTLILRPDTQHRSA